MRISKKAQFIMDELDILFPDADCELNFSNTWELLVAVMLSAQTTDKHVNSVTKDLFKKYPDAESYLLVPLDELENDLRSIGLYRNKSANLQKTAKIIVEQYHGVVPSEHKALVALPGVGQKTANVVQSVGFGIPAFAVDTHVHRVSKRLGLVKDGADVKETEAILCKKFPRASWIKLHHQFIFFGRYLCKAQRPNCAVCPFQNICTYYKKK